MSDTELTAAAWPILTPALASLFNGFNIAFPSRATERDGWIGDAAHQLRVSGHNPDDTQGVRAEYSDDDATPEVRAIDVDVRLHYVGFSMQDVINKILDTPRDLDRLRYIIYAETQWSKSAGWQPRHYDGENPHTIIAHFSGEPTRDNDARPWCVEEMGEDMYTPEQHAAFAVRYDGRGIGENDGESVRRSLLSYFDEMLKTMRRVDQTLIELKEHLGQGSVPHTHEIGPSVPDTALED